jgi:hypothetical protein
MSEEEEGFSLPGERKSLRNLTRGSWPGIEPLLDRAAYMRARALDVMKPFELGSSTSRHTLQFPNAGMTRQKKQALVSSRCDTTIYPHTHTHTHTLTLTYTHTHIHTCTESNRERHTHAHPPTHAHTHTSTHSPTPKLSSLSLSLSHARALSLALALSFALSHARTRTLFFAYLSSEQLLQAQRPIVRRNNKWRAGFGCHASHCTRIL